MDFMNYREFQPRQCRMTLFVLNISLLSDPLHYET